jgi:hypothetical protein
MTVLLADLFSGAEAVATIFLGGTVLAFVVGIIIAMVIRHPLWVWLTGPIVAFLASGFIGWQNFRAAYSAASQTGSGSVLNIDTAPGLPTLIFLFVVFLYLVFWIGMGTLAGREFLEFLNERRQKAAREPSDPSSPS